MAISHAKPGELVDLRPPGIALATTKTTTLVKTRDMELIRLIVPAGKEIPTHKAPGEITVQCLEGTTPSPLTAAPEELAAGQLLYLTAAEPHALKGIEDCQTSDNSPVEKHPASEAARPCTRGFGGIVSRQ